MSDVKFCIVCRSLWCALVLGTCTYVVFGLGHSGWWYALAILCCCFDCDKYRTPAQIEASAKLTDAEARLEKAKSAYE